jgi:sulfur carrier protein|tara:strand:- start:1322 stop:1537 length:216 start_codon:yes stop_codon:yes gene_type:complete
MTITINAEATEIPDDTSVTELLKLHEVKMPEMVSIELNGEILERDKYESTQLSNGDSVELLYFMGGGAIGI